KRELGDKAAAELFGQHHRTIRELLKSFPNAEEIETAGDSFFLVFPTPSAAVHFSLMLQAALRSLRSGSGEGVRDRIGVHVGEVVMSERDDAGEGRDLFGIHRHLLAGDVAGPRRPGAYDSERVRQRAPGAQRGGHRHRWRLGVAQSWPLPA